MWNLILEKEGFGGVKNLIQTCRQPSSLLQVSLSASYGNDHDPGIKYLGKDWIWMENMITGMSNSLVFATLKHWTWQSDWHETGIDISDMQFWPQQEMGKRKVKQKWWKVSRSLDSRLRDTTKIANFKKVSKHGIVKLCQFYLTTLSPCFKPNVECWVNNMPNVLLI